jgi:hypothetical protein
MFAMHRKTRLLLCRFGFVALCILPTTVIAGWIISRGALDNPPARKAEWERELTSRLGLTIEIGQVAYPQPWLARLEAVRLLLPETRQPVAAAAQIDVATSAGGWTIAATGVTFQARQLAALIRGVDERLLREPTPALLKILPCDATIESGDSGQTLQLAGGTFESAAAGSRLEIDFQLPGTSRSQAPIRWRVARNRKLPEPVTQWQIDTASTALPCSLAAMVAPSVARLGNDCAFLGVIDYSSSPTGGTGQFSGTLQRIDLDSLVTDRFPHRLSGLGEATIERAAFESGKLTDVRGRLRIGAGTISSSLVAALQEHLELQAGPEFTSRPPSTGVSFQEFVLGFQLVGETLTLNPGVLLASEGVPMVTIPSGHRSTTTGLLRTLLPDSRYQVPATRQTDALVRLLPLPAVALAPHPPQAHTPARLAPVQTTEAPVIRQPMVR